MTEIKEESKCLASLAVFRELYNNNRDIYAVICEFLKEIISKNGKYQFNLTEITQLLNDTYDFSIPEAVVGTSLNRFGKSLTKSHGIFTVIDKEAFKITGRLTGTHLEIQNNNETVINDLISFIEEKTNFKLTDNEKEKVVHSFCSFIIDESTNQPYSEYVSAFIVKEKKDFGFISRLNTIKEGVVLYTGLKYNSNLNELGSWTTELTVFVETEILFHFAGYNGVLYQTLFNDFFDLVKEINSKNQKKNGKKLIHLKYFTDVKDEIEKFFKKAEHIVSGRDKANPSKTAMTSIIDGCTSPADIIEKKTRFYELLKSNGIIEDDYANYYSDFNHKFNLEDQELLKAISERTGIDDVYPYLKYLSYVNIHRKGNSNRSFENIGYILLSGTSNTIIIALDEAIKPNGSVPLATNLSFITNKLWFRLNKGFGKGTYPKSFDIVTKAQIVLSTQVNNSVAEKFDELQDKYKKGVLSEEQAVASIAELRRQAKKPEDIKEDDLQEILGSIDENSIETYLKEQELFKNKAAKQE
ncbi:MAG: hypothetical protein GYA51_02695, partial [Candidatus Methanofastidiosa archaeon]|nr:hypothetical protein [Candidatus Methanofastidiosa archaeon]